MESKVNSPSLTEGLELVILLHRQYFFEKNYLMFPICDRKDFEIYALLRKLQFFPSLIPLVSLSLFA